MGSESNPVVDAITELINKRGLQDELAANRTVFPGRFAWSRNCNGRIRHIFFAPPDSPKPEYIVSWFDEPHEGKWMGDLNHLLELFARFLIDGEDWRHLSVSNLAYLERASQSPASRPADR